MPVGDLGFVLALGLRRRGFGVSLLAVLFCEIPQGGSKARGDVGHSAVAVVVWVFGWFLRPSVVVGCGMGVSPKLRFVACLPLVVPALPLASWHHVTSLPAGWRFGWGHWSGRIARGIGCLSYVGAPTGGGCVACCRTATYRHNATIVPAKRLISRCSCSLCARSQAHVP